MVLLIAAVSFAPTSQAELWAQTPSGNLDSRYWKLTGNSGTDPSTNFVGTTDNQPFIVKVNSTRVFRLEPTISTPNIIGGFSGNAATSSVGATIGGGGVSGDPNIVIDDFGTVAGGLKNTAGWRATVGGGSYKTAASVASTVAGGGGNTAGPFSGATVGGGFGNIASGEASSVGGGDFNKASGTSATVSGGRENSATDWASVGGGDGNHATGNAAVVGGGLFNVAKGLDSVVDGGIKNSAGGNLAAVGGGRGLLRAWHPVPMADLSGVWAKIDRAKIHRDAIDTHVGEYFSVDVHRPTMMAELDSDSGYHVFRIRHATDLTEFLRETSLILGDAIQNLRASLDHLTFQLADWHTGGKVTKPRSVQFPIDDGDDLFRVNAKRWLTELHPNHVAQIESLQPYRGLAGRPDRWSGAYVHQLALLRDLNDRDKHRLLTVIAAVPNTMSTVLPPGAGFAPIPLFMDGTFSGEVLFGKANRDVVVGAEVMRAPLTGDVPGRVEMAGEITPSITLPERGSVIGEIDRISAFVAYIVREFEPLL